MKNIECIRRWNGQLFSLDCSTDAGDNIYLEDVRGLNCDANEIPEYIIHGAFVFIEDEYKAGTPLSELAVESLILTIPAPAPKEKKNNHPSLKTFEITIRYTCPNDLPNPFDWDWHTLLDIGSMESIQTSINKVETTPDDVQIWEEDTKE